MAGGPSCTAPVACCHACFRWSGGSWEPKLLSQRHYLFDSPARGGVQRIAPGSEQLTVRSTADARDRLVTVNSALPKASALDPQPVLGGVGVVSNRLYGLLVIT